jgi:hypothetical protein
MFRSTCITCVTILLAVAANCLQAASVTLVAPSGHGSVGTEFKAPIAARGAEGLGSFQMELVYDPALVQPLEVEEGTLVGGAMVAFNVIEPGRLRIAVAGNPRTPITGDGELLRVKFKLLGKEGAEGLLKFENALAWEQTNDGFEMLVNTEPGKITIDRVGLPMWVIAAGIAGLIAVAAIVVIGKRRMIGRVLHPDV